jgi:tetratricopeptide (TPR) repeat protein
VENRDPGAVAAERGRAARLAAVLAAVSLFAATGALCLTRVTDTDLWWHLAGGDLIRRTGEVPRAEPFSFTVIGHRWVDIHWLFQVVLSFLYEKGGVRALDVLRGALILGVFGTLYARCRRVAGPVTVVAVLLLVTLACQERFLMRPEIVSWLLMAVVLAALERALRAEDRAARRLILFIGLPLLQMLWVNVQGLFILGPVFVTLALATAGFEYARARRPAGEKTTARDPDRVVDFLVALALAALASLVNPYGAAALRLPFEQFFSHLGGGSLLSRTIAEFQPPLSGYLMTPSIVAFVVLGLVTTLSILVDFPRARLFDLLVTAATLVVALRARRNIPIFALAAAPILARHLSALAGPPAAALVRLAARLRPGPHPPDSFQFSGGMRRAAPVAGSLLLAAVCWGLTLDVVTNRFFLRRPTERWFGSGEIPGHFPEESARFVAASGIPGSVFHSLAAGGYLIHAWRGERGVFIDGRNDPYLDGVLAAYLKAIADPSAFEETVRRYQITAVLWPHHRALEAKPLLSYLARGRGWVLVHLDEAAAVYLRADLASPARLGESPFPPGRDHREVYEGLARRLDDRPFSGPPIREVALGEFFSVSGDAPGAEFFYRKALGRLPGSAPVLYGHALALERLGRAREARADYERAAAADRGYLPAAAALGAFLLEEGKLGEAERRLDAAYRGGERSTRLLLARARLFDEKGDVNRALAAYREALLMAARDTRVLRAVAQFYVRHGEASSALSLYTTAAEADPDDPVIAREMAALLERLGRVTAALDVSRDAGRRALERLAGSRTGEWAAAASGRDEDRRLLLLAAGLEERAGDRARAAEYLAALSR